MIEGGKYSPAEVNRLREHYAALRDKPSYDAFVRYTYELLQRVGADPYHVRMALTKGYSMMEFGSRAAIQHLEKAEGIEIGLLIRAADIEKVEQQYRRHEHTFKPVGGMVFIHPIAPDWNSFPQALLALNEVAMLEEYERIKDTRLVEIRKDSGTTNEALKYAVVKGIQVSLLGDIHFWIFQGNPRFYDTAGALRAKAVRTWTVTAHTDKIKPGDKAIIWVTGQNAACYALATVDSEVLDLDAEEFDRSFVLDTAQVLQQKRVRITVDHNFSEEPIAWSTLKDEPEMTGFKGGNQGTTFTATKDQYDTILRKATKQNKPMSIPLNRIFYGPPGTGKTHHTINAAVETCDPEFYAKHSADRTKIKARYEELRMKDWKNVQGPGRIGFCTFHQSFGYEDFVEGIKPMKPAEGDTHLKYDVRPGVLKQMVQRAEFHASGEAEKVKSLVSFTADQMDKAEFYKLSLGDSQNADDQVIYDHCIKHGVIAIGFLAQHDLSGLTEAQVRALPLEAGQNKYDHTAMSYFAHYLKEGNYVVVTFGLYVVRAIGRVTGDYYYDPKSEIGYPHFRKVEWLVTGVDIPYEELYGRQFSQQSIYKLKKEEIKRDFFVKSSSPSAGTEETKNFVLIIDEINRGNVAGIFGELITLIEENKRKGKPEALEVTLPYSQEPFSIPDNLYIIGTMNTADRSVEALDAALRRRFSFVPMMPDTKDLKPLRNSKVDLHALLKKINERLIQFLDEDHQIGHSHFWELHSKADPIAALREVFADKIIPQLEEYFHRDRARLRLVLGDAFVEKVEADEKLFNGDADDMEFELRPTYKLRPRSEWTEDAFVAIHG